MATRMQQRRGTAAQWISTDSGSGPILASGEIGYESDTNKFKIGDGVNHWLTLDYFIDADSTVNPQFGSNIKFEGTTANEFETTLQVTDPTADRTVTFQDATGTVVLRDSTDTLTNKTLTSPTISGLYLSDGSIVLEGSDESGGGPNYETTLRVTDPTADRILTFPDATGTVAITTDISTAISTAALDTSDELTEGALNLYYTSARSALNAPLASPTFTGTVTLPNTTAIGDVSSTEIGYVNGVTSAIQTQIDTKAPLASPTFTGTVNAAALTLSGDLTVNGTTTTINSTTLVVDDKNIVLGDVTTPSDVTADGGGITLKGATDKTFNWVDATDSWTSSDHLNLASGKSYYVNGTLLKDVTETLTNKTLTSPALTTPTISTLTTAGDLLYGSGSGVLTRLGIGSSTQVLTVVGGVPAWAAGGSAADDDQPILASQIFG